MYPKTKQEATMYTNTNDLVQEVRNLRLPSICEMLRVKNLVLHVMDSEL